MANEGLNAVEQLFSEDTPQIGDAVYQLFNSEYIPEDIPEDTWKTYLMAPIWGAADQVRNVATATLNPVDTVKSIIFGEAFDFDKIHTASDKEIQGTVPNLVYSLGNVLGQAGVTVASIAGGAKAGSLTGAAVGSLSANPVGTAAGAVIGGAVGGKVGLGAGIAANVAGQALAVYEESFKEAYQTLLNEYIAREGHYPDPYTQEDLKLKAYDEASAKSQVTIPFAMIETLIPFGKISKATGLDKAVNKLISAGIIEKAPNGMVKILNMKAFRRFLTGGVEEALQESGEEGGHILVEKVKGYREKTDSLPEAITRMAKAGATGFAVGGTAKTIVGAGRDILHRKTKDKPEYDVEMNAIRQLFGEEPINREQDTTDVDEDIKPLAQEETNSGDEQEATPQTSEEDAPIIEQPEQTVQEEIAPSEEPAPTEPIAEEATPVAEEAAPIVEQPAPPKKRGRKKKAPVVEEAAPVVEEVAPVVEETVTPIIDEVVQEEPPLLDEKGQEATELEAPVKQPKKRGRKKKAATVEADQIPLDIDYTPVDTTKVEAEVDTLEQTQRAWFEENPVYTKKPVVTTDDKKKGKDAKKPVDRTQEPVKYEDIVEDEVYYVMDGDKPVRVLGIELLNQAMGEEGNIVQPEDVVIRDEADGKLIKLHRVPIGGTKRTYTVTIDGVEAQKGIGGKDVRRIVGLHRNTQIRTAKSASGKDVVQVIKPASRTIPNAKGAITTEIGDGDIKSFITTNPTTLPVTSDEVINDYNVEEQARQTRRASMDKYASYLSEDVKEARSHVKGSGNPDEFGKLKEFNTADNDFLNQQDTVPVSPEDTLRAMNIDLSIEENALSNKENEAGIDGKNSYADLVKAGKKVPPYLFKNKMRHLVNKFAAAMDTIILDKLAERGMLGKHVTSATEGSTATKLGFSRVKNAMNFLTALHEVGHNVWQVNTDRLSGIKRLVTKTGISILDLDRETQNVFPALNSTLDLEAYRANQLTEEIFSELFARYLTTNDISKYQKLAPNTTHLIDMFIDNLNGAREIVEQLRTLNDTYQNLSPSDRIKSNIITSPTDAKQTWLQKVKEYLGQDWWFTRVWTDLFDRTAFTRRVGRHLAKHTYKVPGKMYYFSDYIEYVQQVLPTRIKTFLFENGSDMSGNPLGRQFKPVAAMISQIEDVAIASLPENMRSDKKAVQERTLQISDNFLTYLYALDTFGSYTGNKTVMGNLKRIIRETNLPMKKVVTAMQAISNRFWELFVRLEPINVLSLNGAHRLWLEHNEIDVDEFVKLFNEIVTVIPSPSKTFLETYFINTILRPKENTSDLIITNEDLQQALMQYLYINYAIVDPDKVPDTGITLADALDHIDTIESGEDNSMYMRLAEDYYTYQNSLLDYVGTYSKGGKAWVDSVKENGHAYYIPLLRVFENQEQLTDYPEVGSEFYNMYSRKGSDRPVENIWVSTIRQTNSLIYGAHQSRIKEQMVELAKTVGGGRWIQEVTQKEKLSSLTVQNLLEQIRGTIQERYDELKKQGVPAEGLTDTGVNKLAIAMRKAKLASINLFTSDMDYYKMQKERMFSVWDPKTNTLRFYQVDRSLWKSFNTELNNLDSKLPIVNKVLYLSMYLARKGMIDWNPKFNLVVNPFRDAITSAYIKGDVKLINLPNYPILEAFIPFNRLAGAMTNLVTNYYYHFLAPDKLAIRNARLDKIGVGFNMRRGTYEDLTKKAKASAQHFHPGLSPNKINRIMDITTWLGEDAQSTDKWARVAELNAYMKRHNLDPEQLDVCATRAASLTLTKGMLKKLGINEKTLSKILTPEQLDVFKNTADKDYMYIDLSDEQLTAMDKLIENDSSIQLKIKQNTLSYHHQVQLNRAVALATTDFSRGGLLSGEANKLFLFSRAATNGFVQYAEVLKRKWHDGRQADIYGALLEMFMIGLISNLLGFDDDDDYSENESSFIRYKFGDHTIDVPVQYPDQLMHVAAKHFARLLRGEHPESIGDVLYTLASNANPYSSIGGLIGLGLDYFSNKELSRFSTRPIVTPKDEMALAGKNVYRPAKPEEIIKHNTGKLAINISKWTGVPAKMVQHLMNNAGLRFWDKLLGTAMAADRFAYTPMGNLISTSGGFLEYIKRDIFNIDRPLYKTSYEIGMEKIYEIAKDTYDKDNSSDNLKFYENAAAAHGILRAYSFMQYSARTSELRDEIRTAKQQAARELWSHFKQHKNINADLLQGYMANTSKLLAEERRTLGQASKKYVKEIKSTTLEADKKAATKKPFDVSSLLIPKAYADEPSYEETFTKAYETTKSIPDLSTRNTIIDEKIKSSNLNIGIKGKMQEDYKAFRNDKKQFADVDENLKPILAEVHSKQANLYRETHKNVAEKVEALKATIPHSSEWNYSEKVINKVMSYFTWNNNTSDAPITDESILNLLRSAQREVVNEYTISLPESVKVLGSAQGESPTPSMLTTTGAGSSGKAGSASHVYGMLSLDTNAPGGKDTMTKLLNTPEFKDKFKDALKEDNSIDYETLPTIWEDVFSNKENIKQLTPVYINTVRDAMFTNNKDGDVLDVYKEVGFSVDNDKVKDAILAIELQGGTKVKGVPTRAYNIIKSKLAKTKVSELSESGQIELLLKTAFTHIHPDYKSRFNRIAKVLIGKEIT